MEGILVAVLAAASINVGKVLQKRGTIDLPKFTPSKVCLQRYLRNSHWLSGFVLDIVGGVMTLFALAVSPVSIVQPVMGSGLGIAALFSNYYLREQLTSSEWIGCCIVMAGTIGVGLTAVDLGNSEVDQVFAGCLLLFCASIVGFTELQMQKKKIPIELGTGLQIGICFAISAVSSRLGVLLADELGIPILAALGIMGSIGLTSSGFVLQTRGMKEGRAVVIITIANIISIIVAVLFGLLALGEKLPEDPPLFLCRLLSLAGVLSGTVLLVPIGPPSGQRLVFLVVTKPTVFQPKNRALGRSASSGDLTVGPIAMPLTPSSTDPHKAV